VNSVSSRFAAVEQVSLVGTRGKLEAFAPSHGTKQDDESEVNFRRCLRSAKFIAEYEERELAESSPRAERELAQKFD